MPSRSTVAIHQPNLFPRLPTLAKLYAADIWIVLDDVQFNARDYQHRAWLEHPDTASGQWLTLPVHRPQGRTTRIKDVQLLEPTKSARRVSQLVHQYYGHCHRWPELRDTVEATADAIRHTERLAEVAELSTRRLLDHMGWHGTAVRSSSLVARSERSARLADLTAAIGATEYLCGTGGAKYLDETPFTSHGLTVRYTHVPALTALRERKLTSGLWWLMAVEWDSLRELLWGAGVQPVHRGPMICPTP